MDLESVKELIKLMEDHNLDEVEIEEEGRAVRLRRGVRTPEPGYQPAAPPPVVAAASNPPPAAPTVAGALVITSPIVGTFYRKPAPEAQPYADVGDVVEPDTVVCIIEAMKVMNEIRAEVRGRIKEICATDGAPVEYGQTLFRLEPTD